MSHGSLKTIIPVAVSVRYGSFVLHRYVFAEVWVIASFFFILCMEIFTPRKLSSSETQGRIVHSHDIPCICFSFHGHAKVIWIETTISLRRQFPLSLRQNEDTVIHSIISSLKLSVKLRSRRIRDSLLDRRITNSVFQGRIIRIEMQRDTFE